MVQCKKKRDCPTSIRPRVIELSRNAHHAIGGGFHTLSHPKDYLLDSPFIDLL